MRRLIHTALVSQCANKTLGNYKQFIFCTFFNLTVLSETKIIITGYKFCVTKMVIFLCKVGGSKFGYQRCWTLSWAVTRNFGNICANSK
jgi:hypothetical protein